MSNIQLTNIKTSLKDQREAINHLIMLKDFDIESIETREITEGHEICEITGKVKRQSKTHYCPLCKNRMHKNSEYAVRLRHISMAKRVIDIVVIREQYYCAECHVTKVTKIPFKSKAHRITKLMENYIVELLEKSTYTLKNIAELTSVGKNTIKAIDYERLKKRYRTREGKLKPPERQARFLGIDEFKLHNGYQYATNIIDLETGHVLWVERGKKKHVVYNFIKYAGDEWMKKVKAVACDMNSDFYEAFREKCPHMRIVFDYFHVVKNFNDKVISRVRIEEQKRLIDEGEKEAAQLLKKSKYILLSNQSTLQKKEEDTEQNPKELYDKLLSQNKLLFTADLVKTGLQEAYRTDSINRMRKHIKEIISMCRETKNQHFLWFAKLLENHKDGIISHGRYKISSGKTEGINNKIKTIRRQGYGYPEDDYFFLKIMDASRYHPALTKTVN